MLREREREREAITICYTYAQELEVGATKIKGKKKNQFQWHQSFQILSKTVFEKGKHAKEEFINKSIPIPRYVQARMVKLY